MNWLILIAAGILEVGFAVSIKSTENFTRPLPTVLCLVLMISSVYLLSWAMNTIPVGTAYVVFTGIGAVGAVTLGVVIAGDAVTLTRLASLALIVGGIALARLTTTS
ncbi:quaternary ammonium compound-resistance protein SugE [Amycolatopsis marina]|uniref:Quaternary ammonium compound-resistance protein SugE n=1 Tax=Amycolatopsis marina TaxID=490629 RepID=A0A1I0W3L7_9PSEU|nr:multidrug efflux SMR transporter [Amycolatopsis marina]SFA82830.1 quaternary ammonium compound-resistance protein SugE [Amycolatopsis marina]